MAGRASSRRTPNAWVGPELMGVLGWIAGAVILFATALGVSYARAGEAPAPGLSKAVPLVMPSGGDPVRISTHVAG